MFHNPFRINNKVRNVNSLRLWRMLLILLCRMVRPLQQALVLLLMLLLGTCLVYAEPEEEHRRIRKIHFYISNINTEEQAQEAFWAKTTNRLHIVTRESVVRKQILFKEGDVLDQELIEQSERKLRRFAFLNVAQIKVVPVDHQSVDVEVRTRDAWTLVPGVNVSGGGGLATGTVMLEELNLLGYGKKLLAEGIYESDVGWTGKFGYRDPQLFNSRWIGTATYTTGPLVESLFLGAARPLYSIDTKWSYGSAFFITDQTIRLFEEGEESSRFAKDQMFVQGYVKRAFGERFQKTNLKLELKYLQKDFSDLGSDTTEPPPPDQANVTPSIRIGKQGNISWQKFSYLNKMGLTEDTMLGPNYGAHVGYGIPVQEGFELWDIGAYLMGNKTFIHKQLLKTILGVNSEVERNTFINANARYYRKFTRHTVATRFLVNLGYELDSSKQFTLGADSGLRGYPARYFTGERLMVINLEDRQFWGEYTIGPKLALGTVLFVDAGNVWKEADDAELNDLNWSAGTGLRLGWSNLPNQPIFRLDVGWAFDDPGGWAVTVGTEQQF